METHLSKILCIEHVVDLMECSHLIRHIYFPIRLVRLLRAYVLIQEFLEHFQTNSSVLVRYCNLLLKDNVQLLKERSYCCDGITRSMLQ
jgi:hypothetical protein